MTPAQPTGGVVAREDAVEIVVDEGARLWEGAVVAGMVEVEMAVHDYGDIVGTDPDACETRDDRVIANHDRFHGALRAVRRVGAVDMDGMNTGIEEDDALARPKKCRPHRNTNDLGSALRKECRARQIDQTGP